MTREEIAAAAMRAGVLVYYDRSLVPVVPGPDFIERLMAFGALIAAAENEACAKACEETTAAWTQHLYNEGAMDCAAAIRARGEQR